MPEQNPAKPFCRSWRKICRPWRSAAFCDFLTHEILACLCSRPSFTVSTIKTLDSILNPLKRWRAGLCGLLVVVSGFAAELPALLEYRIGDQAEADIVTPVALVVFDPVRTKNLRTAEAQRVNPVFRHLPAAAAQSEASLVAAFTNAQSRFTAGLENLFGHPLPLLNAEFDQPHYAAFLKAYREQNPDFPLTTQLAELWAFGDDGQIALERQLARLRRFTNTLVRPDALPAGERLTTASVRLISVTNVAEPIALATVDRQGRNAARTNLVTLGELRQSVERLASAPERPEARYVAGFLRPNCFFDEELTRQNRLRRTEPINAADRYEAGQVIVKQGDVVTEKTKLALDELQSRTAAQRIQANADLERSRVEAEATQAQRAAEETLQTNRWLLAALGVAAVAFVALGLFLFIRRRALLEARRRSAGGGHALVVQSAAEDAWRERALAAEARAQKATAMLRTKMLPHMARWMMQEFMQRLMLQRRVILSDQQTAEREVAELADRLEHVHAPLEDRLRAYERRIAELEAELAARGEQNLELIKARIETTRRKLDGERTRESQESLNLG